MKACFLSIMNRLTLTVFENYSKWRIWVFQFWHFALIFALSGNTVLPQASTFQDHFCHFLLTFVHSKCKRSSLRSQYWMRLFGVIFKHCVISTWYSSDFPSGLHSGDHGQLSTSWCLGPWEIYGRRSKLEPMAIFCGKWRGVPKIL